MSATIVPAATSIAVAASLTSPASPRRRRPSPHVRRGARRPVRRAAATGRRARRCGPRRRRAPRSRGMRTQSRSTGAVAGDDLEDAAEGVEALEAGVRHDHDVGVGRTVEHGQRPGRPGRVQVPQRGQLGRPLGVALRQSGHGPGPLLGVGPGALGEDHGALVRVAYPLGHRADRVELGLRVGCAPVEEVVGQPVADDVEAGIGQQLALEHVVRLEPRLGHEPRGEQRVGQARVARQDDHRTRARAASRWRGSSRRRQVSRRPTTSPLAHHRCNAKCGAGFFARPVTKNQPAQVSPMISSHDHHTREAHQPRAGHAPRRGDEVDQHGDGEPDRRQQDESRCRAGRSRER